MYSYYEDIIVRIGDAAPFIEYISIFLRIIGTGAAFNRNKFKIWFVILCDDIANILKRSVCRLIEVYIYGASIEKPGESGAGIYIRTGGKTYDYAFPPGILSNHMTEFYPVMKHWRFAN